MFAHLDDAERFALARHLHWLCLPGGRHLFRAGEPADALYLLRSGSLGVFDGPTTLVHQVAADECVGEMSLLSGEPHHFEVRALRDSELFRLDRAAFEALIEQHPKAMLDVARVAIDRLLRRERHTEKPDTPRTFAILPVDSNVPVRALAMQLGKALETFGSCVVIDAEHGTGRGSDWFAEREAQARFVIYLDSTGDAMWRQRCLRQAARAATGQYQPAAMSADQPRHSRNIRVPAQMVVLQLAAKLRAPTACCTWHHPMSGM